MRLAISIAAFASVDGLRRRSKEKAQSNSEMRNDHCPAVDRDSETLLGVHGFSTRVSRTRFMRPRCRRYGGRLLQTPTLRRSQACGRRFSGSSKRGEAKDPPLASCRVQVSMNVWDTSPFTGISDQVRRRDSCGWVLPLPKDNVMCVSEVVSQLCALRQHSLGGYWRV